jgi:hypothetical protein
MPTARRPMEKSVSSLPRSEKTRPSKASGDSPDHNALSATIPVFCIANLLPPCGVR